MALRRTTPLFLFLTLILTAFVTAGSLSAQDGADEEPKRDEAPELEGGLTPDENPILELVDEITTNMKTIEDLLNQRDTGSSTQDMQQSTITKIDRLIEEMEKAAQQSSSSSSSSQKQRNQQQKESQDQKQGKQQQELNRQKEQQQQKNQQSQEPKNPEESPNTQTSEGAMPPSEVGDLENRQGRGRWGRLPKRVVEQMYDNGRRKLPAKYQLLLEEYFGRLPQSKGQ